MLDYLKKWANDSFDKHGERKNLLRYLKDLKSSNNLNLLDVGCGKGKYLKLAKDNGLSVVGVDASEFLVSENKRQGFECYHVSELSELKGKKFNAILLSHIIEHIQPHDLLHFIDGYLDYLDKNGFLIICTPLLTSHFYNDFDHIKPYHPQGIMLVFGDDGSQVQYQSKNKLKLKDLRYRVYPYRITHARGLYIPSWTTPLISLFNNLMGLVSILSFRKVAKKDGWIGLFQKV